MREKAGLFPSSNGIKTDAMIKLQSGNGWYAETEDET